MTPRDILSLGTARTCTEAGCHLSGAHPGTYHAPTGPQKQQRSGTYPPSQRGFLSGASGSEKMTPGVHRSEGDGLASMPHSGLWQLQILQDSTRAGPAEAAHPRASTACWVTHPWPGDAGAERELKEAGGRRATFPWERRNLPSPINVRHCDSGFLSFPASPGLLSPTQMWHNSSFVWPATKAQEGRHKNTVPAGLLAEAPHPMGQSLFSARGARDGAEFGTCEE